MCQSTVVKILHKRLQLWAYKVQIVQLQSNDLSRELFSLEKILERIAKDNDYLHVAFSEAAAFRISGRGNTHNVRTWGSENLHVVLEHQRDNCKLNLWCCLMHDKAIGLFFL